MTEHKDFSADEERQHCKYPGPALICRTFEDDQEERSHTQDIGAAIVEALPFNGGGYLAEVEVFRSEDTEDRGGYVIRLTSMSDDGFIPAGREVTGGVELHLGGESEGEAFMEALRKALARAK